MAKRSEPEEMDIVTETQQNSRWFFGSNTSKWSEMTAAEKSRVIRLHTSDHPTSMNSVSWLSGGIAALIIGGGLSALIIRTMLDNGFPLALFVVGVIPASLVVVGIVSIIRAFRKH